MPSEFSVWFLDELDACCQEAATDAQGRAGSCHGGEFTSFDFQRVLHRHLETQHRPGMAACRRLLARLPWIERVDVEVRTDCYRRVPAQCETK